MQQSTKQIYEFGPFRLNSNKRALLKDGEPVPLTSKAFGVLLLLVENQGQALAKGKIIDHVWSDAFIEEGNLPVHISALRKALGDNRGDPRYIATVPGGYQFIAEVHVLLDAELFVNQHEHQRIVIEEHQETKLFVVVLRAIAAFVRRFHLGWQAVMISVMLLILVTAAVVVARLLQKQAPVNTDYLTIQFASWKTEPGVIAPAPTARFSHDGRMVAFSSTKSGDSNIWIKQTRGGDQIQITRGDWIDMTPIWSPDGEQVAFISNRGGQDGIWASLAHGGTATLLAPLAGSAKALRHWSQDGKTIYYELDHNLYALDIGSKLTSQITAFNSSPAFSRDFSISADEKWMAYVDSQEGQFDIWVMPLAGGDARRITNDAYNDLYPAWHPDGTKIIYSSDRGTAYQLFVVDVDGHHEPRSITSTSSDCLASDVSADGTRILFTAITEDSDLCGVKTEGGAAFEITSEVGLEVWPEISPDGKAILFQSANGSERLLDSVIRSKVLASGGQEIQLAAKGYEAHWSPDGRQVAFLHAAEGHVNLWAINAAGGEARQLTTNELRARPFRLIPLNRSPEGGYSWSPDSSRIAYCATTADQRNIWTVSADGATQTKISNATDPNQFFTRPFWSRDGARIASVMESRAPSGARRASWSVWISDLGTIFQYPSYLWLMGWSASDDGLLAVSTTDKNKFNLSIADVDLFEISVAGSRRAIAQLNQAYPDNIELSPDGKMIAYVSRQDGWDNVWVIAASGGPTWKLTTNTNPRDYLSTLTWSPDGKAIYYGKQNRSNEISMIQNFN